MGAEEHDFLGPGAPLDLADHVGRARAAQAAGGEPELQDHRVFAVQLAREHIGVRRRERGRRDARDAVLIDHLAGVGQPVAVCTQRAQDQAHGAQTRRHGWTVDAAGHRCAVVGRIRAAFDPFVDEYHVARDPIRAQ